MSLQKMNFSFVGPNGSRIMHEVQYEWMPVRCSKCSKWGHKELDCRRIPSTKQVWMIKKKDGAVENLVVMATGKLDVKEKDGAWQTPSKCAFKKVEKGSDVLPIANKGSFSLLCEQVSDGEFGGSGGTPAGII
ncbi:hypothetical protein Droror1_Dr00025723 [Drosera rotundifolia]